MPRATVLEKINPFLKKANYTVSLFLVVIFFFVLMIHLNTEVRDLDIWLHLKTGEQIVLNNEVPLTDQLSFTKEGSSWVNHSWLFQVLAYIFYANLGIDGLILFQNLVFLALFFILLAIGLRKSNFLFVTSALFILLLNSSYRFTIRPDMFSLLFLVVFIYILKEKNKYLNLLPLLQVLWVNSHGFFFIGPLLILIFSLTEKKKKLWIIFVFSLLATIINPQLIKGAIYPLRTLFGLFGGDRFIFEFVQELKRPISLKTLFDVKDWSYYKALIFFSIFSFRFNQKKFNITLFILWFISLLFSLCAIRNIVYFAIVATIVIFYNANERFSYDKDLSNERFIKNKYYFLGRYFLIFSFSLCMVKNATLNIDCRYFDFDNYNFKSCMWGVSQRNFPQKPVDFILRENLPLRMFNDFNSGSYLIGRTYPMRKVFIDGRTEFYGSGFLKLYKKVVDGEKDAVEQIIKQFDLEGFFLTMAMSNFDEKLAKYLFEHPEWKAVYFDDSAFIFLKDTPMNKNLIEKYYIDLKVWKAPNENLGKIVPVSILPYKNISRGRALHSIGCLDAAISEARVALKIMPTCFEAFEILSKCYLDLEQYPQAVENLRLALILAPHSIGLRSSLALALYKAGYFKEAEIQLSKLIALRPKDPENYYFLAKTYRKINKLVHAQQMAAKACKYSDNKNFDYLKLWANILFDLKQFKESLKTYERAQKIQPEDAEIKENLKKIEKIL